MQQLKSTSPASPVVKEANIFYNGIFAGLLTKTGRGYRFVYNPAYLNRSDRRPVSITLPLRAEPYESDLLFPPFINMLSEGSNKRVQSRLLKIDEKDYFGLLLATAGGDSIGPVTIETTNEVA